MAFMAITTSEAMSLGGNKDEAAEQNAEAGGTEDNSDWMQYLNNRFEKRFDPSDPKSLFASVYGSNYNGGYKKRYDPVGDLYRTQRAYKPNDPRSLFRAVYGYRK